jgi:hypothetical protein
VLPLRNSIGICRTLRTHRTGEGVATPKDGLRRTTSAPHSLERRCRMTALIRGEGLGLVSKADREGGSPPVAGCPPPPPLSRVPAESGGDLSSETAAPSAPPQARPPEGALGPGSLLEPLRDLPRLIPPRHSSPRLDFRGNEDGHRQNEQHGGQGVHDELRQTPACCGQRGPKGPPSTEQCGSKPNACSDRPRRAAPTSPA